jgi:glycosyltransferase involved in cell wall biosynthesis
MHWEKIMDNEKYHIVHTESSGGWGGQEIRILNEIREFLASGYRVTLICDIASPIAKRAKEYQIPTVELPIGKKTFKGLFSLCQWFRENDFDIINTHSSSDSWMAALGMRLAFNIKPLVRTRHVSAPISNNWATCWLYQTASDYIVTTGEKLRDTLITENNIPANKISSVPTGIDTSLFVPATDKIAIRQSLGLPTDKIIIGIVATLRSWKGHQYLIKAFQRINNPNTHLLIVGDGPQWDNISKKIRELNIESQVTLCGDQKDVVPWLQTMDIFTLPSYANEGVPQSIMQAMSCGLPVISTNAGSIEEIVTAETGIIVKTKSTKSLQQAITTLLENTSLQKTLGNNAINFAQQNCTISVMKNKMEHIFSQILKNSSEKTNTIVILTKGKEAPSFRYRLQPLIEALQKKDYRCHIETLSGSRYLWRIWKKRKLYKQASILIFHKLLLPKIETALLCHLNPNTILDIDDAIYLKEPKWVGHQRKTSVLRKQKFNYVASKCNLVVTGNDFLKQKVESIGGRAVTFPTGIDANTSRKKQTSPLHCKAIWIGLPSNLRYLEIIRPSLETISKKYPHFTLQIICNEFPNWTGVRIEKIQWSPDTEKQYLANADIGIMPLDDSEYSRGKCAFKLLQYMAAGLPCIASPVGANCDVVTHGDNGYLASTPEEWTETLSLLINNTVKRNIMGASSKKIATTKYLQSQIATAYADYMIRHELKSNDICQ